MGDSNLTDYWEEKRQIRQARTQDGYVGVFQVKSRYQIIAPYSDAFRVGMRKLGAKWRYRSRCWSVRSHDHEAIVTLIASCFGAEKVPEWMRLGKG